jgi:2-oxoacid:acceptor oxidoreductase gamma subunit (pyruvate/2-ketoisovalerate family)
MALAAIGEGLYAQSFPSFGPERRGAPVTAFLRDSKARIRVRSKVYRPDVVVVLDPSKELCVCHLPYDPDYPQICMDETRKWRCPDIF